MAPSSEEASAMTPTATRTAHLLSSLTSITTRITTIKTTHSIRKPICLVAVSKLKPLSDIIALAASPSQTHFGENYVQELLQKSRLLPPSLQGKIRWHFIGGLQSNKAQTLAREVRGLWAVESVDSVKKATLLNKGRGELLASDPHAAGEGNDDDDDDDEEGGEGGGGGGGGGGGEKGQLRVFVQVNTSGEETKSGVQPNSSELLNLCKHIRSDCPNLKLRGLMTIGAIARSKATTAETENEDFHCLKETRDWVVKELGLKQEELKLSMGMSGDFEAAIRMGSDEVRVGSTIFGERPPKGEAQILPEKKGEEGEK